MGEVWRAHDTLTTPGRSNQISVAAAGPRSHVRATLPPRIRSGGTAKQPHIIPIHDYSEIDGR
jgi:hypothetical protein